jgi:hypothetical protein
MVRARTHQFLRIHASSAQDMETLFVFVTHGGIFLYAPIRYPNGDPPIYIYYCTCILLYLYKEVVLEMQTHF